MTDARFFTILGLLILGTFIFGVVVGWCTHEEWGE